MEKEFRRLLTPLERQRLIRKLERHAQSPNLPPEMRDKARHTAEVLRKLQRMRAQRGL